MDTLRHSPPMQDIRSLYCLQQHYSVKEESMFSVGNKLKILVNPALSVFNYFKAKRKEFGRVFIDFLWTILQ